MESPVGLSQIWSGGLIYIVPFLFVLTIIVFFHELGHFLVGRWCGIKALVFSVGFGPELIGFNDRRGTRWKLAAVPLGGYVKFLGDENAASVPDRAAMDAMSDAERSGAFPAKSVGRRAATVAAGPIANFILAIVIFAGVAYVEGRVVGDPVVAEVRDGSPAAAAGFKAGDKVLSADGETIRYFSDLQRYVSSRADTPIRMTVERNGSPVELTVTPRSEVQTDGFGNEFNVPVVGLVANNDGSSFRVESLSPVEAVAYGVSQTWFVTTRTVDFMGEVITGRQNADQIGGPIRIAQVSSQVSTIGLGALLNLAALLSVSIGLLNLLPIPMLDGGHLLFYAFEAIRGRPLSEQVQEVGFRIGLALVMLLMVFAFWNDISGLV
ncbi:membrane-associated zinc metalloprotease [Aurantimonas manganoxydans SI85-9A1]|uniref:Zinc metalloprotease n=2 Tax=Aurantimonas manganoxydans TaxID=651183 RepID=Q1YI41_AURMS|nr:RIP metalloprotease RseP [Aurantimonas manganoxydans]EAS50276.1 membrane-associated zinc metalloprotease [Aurantimonas manganoxydans SI85-9A1]BAT29509.1 membrane-associated zinc metalloprotease [Aurantimonas manganoxydans SI85-9A1]